MAGMYDDVLPMPGAAYGRTGQVIAPPTAPTVQSVRRPTIGAPVDVNILADMLGARIPTRAETEVQKQYDLVNSKRPPVAAAPANRGLPEPQTTGAVAPGGGQGAASDPIAKAFAAALAGASARSIAGILPQIPQAKTLTPRELAQKDILRLSREQFGVNLGAAKTNEQKLQAMEIFMKQLLPVLQSNPAFGMMPQAMGFQDVE